MRILLINHYAGSPSRGMEYRPYFLAREWVAAGHEVTILGASFSHLRQSNPTVENGLLEEKVDGIRYIWLSTIPYATNGALRAINIFQFVLKGILHSKKILRGMRPDVVIASSTYPLDIVLASRIASAMDAKLVYEVHDLWPLSPIELGGMSPGHPFIRVMQWAENFAYKKSDVIVSMLPKAESHMRAHGLAEGKFRYVPNGIDMSEWDNRDVLPMPEELGIRIRDLKKQGYFLVGYAGAHGPANALGNCVHAADYLKNEKIKFILVGQGQERDNLIQLANNLRVANVVFLPSIQRKFIPAFLNSMDALYIGLQRTPIFRFGVSPNKLMDYMMAAKPIIQAIDAGNDMVEEAGCGISVPPESPQDLANAVLRLKRESAENLQAMGERGKGYVRVNHDYRILAQKFIAAIS